MFEQKMKKILELIKNKEFDEATTQLSQIIEDSDLSGSDLAKVYLVQGFAFQQQGQLDKAIEVWSQIPQEDDAEVYAQAQFHTGLIYKDQYNLDKVIEAWGLITRGDDEQLHVTVQLYLGAIYHGQEKLEKAINAYISITKKDDAQIYARAQVGLGLIYEQQDKVEEAIEAYKSVDKKDGAEFFAGAQLNLGSLYRRQGKWTEAIRSWCRVSREDDIIFFVKAQFNLGSAYYQQGELEKAIRAWKRISKDDLPDIYISAQQNLIIILEEQNLTKKSCEILVDHLENIKDICDEGKAILENKYKIYTSNINLENKKNLIHVLEKVEDILKALWVKPTDEKAIAHYTNLTVSKLLLGVKDKKITSSFRLNTIQLMNDPKEGELLYPLIDFKKQKDPKDIAFISCFTLHHDSLNQFRLYGKEAEKEASGVSLVLNQKFFASKHDTASIYYDISKQELIKIDKVVNEENKKLEKENNLEPLPLYRCIYLDPKSELVKVAQREEWSFYREYVKADQTEKKFTREKIKAKNEYKKYLKKISIVEKNIESLLNSLRDEINSINKKSEFIEQQLLADILLPLRFLIKHIAFKEEQECRVLYVTQSENNIIQYDGKIDRLYIDYKAYVLEHLEKIYLAPRATNQKEIYEYLCIRGRDQLGIKKNENKSVKVKISQHPFR